MHKVQKKPQSNPKKSLSVVQKNTQVSAVSVATHTTKGRQAFEMLAKPTTAFTQALAREIVKNLTTIGQITTGPFRRSFEKRKKVQTSVGDHPVFVDTSVLVDGRILPIVNSGFMGGTLVVPEFVLRELQHIADDSDTLRRAKGRRGLDVVGKLKGQKVNRLVSVKFIKEDDEDSKEVDHKLVSLAKRHSARLLTVDFNLAQLARAQGIKVLNVNDLAQAIKVALVPGEDLSIKITHEGKERQQGVGYLTDGTMVIVDNARDKVGIDVDVVVTKVHQTSAGQLFFARLK